MLHKIDKMDDPSNDLLFRPDQLFYNTGISTYVWILSNHKTPERKGKIQLINATGAKDEKLNEFFGYWRVTVEHPPEE